MTHPFNHSRSSSLLQFACYASLVSILLMFSACGKKEDKMAPRPIPGSAQVLINPPADAAEAVLLHTVDSATEFPAALNSVEPDVAEPEIRTVTERPPPGSDSTAQVVVGVPSVRAAVPLKQDWGGVILVPDMNKMSRGFTSRVTLTRIEAHPIANDYFRVWVRVRNDSRKDIEADVACNFRALNLPPQETEFIPINIPQGGSANAYFISPMPNMAYYTILVR
jgi:hypothetical protein